MMGTRAYTQVAEQTRRDELIVDHLWLVRHVVGKLFARLPPGVDLDNLMSAGTLGLVEASNKFDPERGIQFKTYAYIRIRGAVLDEMRRNCPLSQHMLEQVGKVRKAYEQLPVGATVEALASRTGLSEDDVVDCLSAMRMTRMMSWDSDVDSMESCQTDRQEQPDFLAELAEQKLLLAEAIEGLPERERLVVTLYFMEDLRLKEIGQVLHLSESRVSRLLNGAIFQLGEFMRVREQ